MAKSGHVGHWTGTIFQTLLNLEGNIPGNFQETSWSGLGEYEITRLQFRWARGVFLFEDGFSRAIPVGLPVHISFRYSQTMICSRMLGSQDCF